MFNLPVHQTRLLLIGLVVRLMLAPFTVQSYDFVHVYYSVFDIAKGINPYSVYDFSYPPITLYILSLLAIIYFKSNMFFENLNWPSAMDWPPSLFKAGVVSVTLIGFHVPPPLFNLIFKIPIIISDLAVALLIYKICHILSPNPSFVWKPVMLWYLNPLVIWMSSVHGAFDSIAVFFSLLGFYCLIGNYFFFGAFSTVLGIFTKLYPVFIVPVAMVYSIKAKRLFSFTAGILSSTAVCLTPIAISDIGAFYHGLFGTRASSLFLGGLNPWATKYIFPRLEPWIAANSYAIFLTMSFLLGLSILFVCRRAWLRLHQRNIREINYFLLSSLVASYVFSPVIIQPQYALWALPFLIISYTSLTQPSVLHTLNIQATLVNKIRLKITHRFSYMFYLHLFWASALSFEIALQALSVVIPSVLMFGFFADIISMTITYWVTQGGPLRAVIFFSAAILCTLSYLIPLVRAEDTHSID